MHFLALKWFPCILGNDLYKRKEYNNQSCTLAFVKCAQSNDSSWDDISLVREQALVFPHKHFFMLGSNRIWLIVDWNHCWGSLFSPFFLYDLGCDAVEMMVFCFVFFFSLFFDGTCFCGVILCESKKDYACCLLWAPAVFDPIKGTVCEPVLTEISGWVKIIRDKLSSLSCALQRSVHRWKLVQKMHNWPKDTDFYVDFKCYIRMHPWAF